MYVVDNIMHILLAWGNYLQINQCSLWTIFRDSVDFVQKLRFRLLMLRKLPISALQELEK